MTRIRFRWPVLVALVLTALAPAVVARYADTWSFRHPIRFMVVAAVAATALALIVVRVTVPSRRLAPLLAASVVGAIAALGVAAVTPSEPPIAHPTVDATPPP